MHILLSCLLGIISSGRCFSPDSSTTETAANPLLTDTSPKTTFHLMISDIPMGPVRGDQRHQERFTP